MEGDWLVALAQEAARAGRAGSGSRSKAISSARPWSGSRPATSAPSLALVAGLALIEALDIAAPDATLMLKWPNDLMLGGAKLAGILLERSGDRVVAGFGVNLAKAPHNERETAPPCRTIAPQAFVASARGQLRADARRLAFARSRRVRACLAGPGASGRHQAGGPSAAPANITGTFAGIELTVRCASCRRRMIKSSAPATFTGLNRQTSSRRRQGLLRPAPFRARVDADNRRRVADLSRDRSAGPAGRHPAAEVTHALHHDQGRHQIFYKDWGPKDAQPIVFHHGWPLSADDWDNQLMFFLGQGYRVIAHDRRGHGRSSQTDGGNEMDTYAADVDGTGTRNSTSPTRSTSGIRPAAAKSPVMLRDTARAGWPRPSCSTPCRQ